MLGSEVPSLREGRASTQVFNFVFPLLAFVLQNTFSFFVSSLAQKKCPGELVERLSE